MIAVFKCSLWRLGLYVLLGGLFASCNMSPVEPNLTSTATGAQVSPNCASCHSYPVGGINHQFHLMHADSLKHGNGSITCLDCHSASVQKKDVVVLDSLFADSSGALFSSYDAGLKSSFRDAITQGNYRLSKIDTLIHHRPIPFVAPSERITYLQEWLTTGNHLNGKVDVKFDANNSDPVRYAGRTATFNPTLETCSAVACHKNNTPYRWPAPSKGLTGLNANSTTE